MYDIFYIGPEDEHWKKLKQKFPLSKRAANFQIAQKNSFTVYFWVVWHDLQIADNFNFNYKVSKWDEEYIHVFRNGNFYDGVCLFPKKISMSKREIDYRFFTNKKEIDIQASTPKPFDIFYINTYNEYKAALANSTTNMFWVVWRDLQITDGFKFDYQVPYYNQQVTHVFRNGEYYDGVCLLSKELLVSSREIDYRFFTNKKEIDIQASTSKPFDVFYIDTYEEYKAALTTSTTNMFWVVWRDLTVSNDFKFDYQVPYYNQQITHVFRNGEYYDGVCLFSKTVSVSNKELDYRFFTNKKEIDILASTPKPFDVAFISYYEPNADIHYLKLIEKLGRHVYRVNGVKGIHNAHIQAATLVNSDLFWVVDADAILETNFNFEFPQVIHHDTYTKSTVHVWTSRNPINDLQYGNGGVKLLPRKLTLNMDLSKLDMTTSISPSFKSMPEVSNIAAFNTDEFTTWRSAFRECVKLSSKTIQGQVNSETEERLNVWCSVGKDRLYGKYAILGALAGRTYGQENAGNLPALTLINDYDWLKETFEQSRSLMETHLQ